MGDEMQGNHRPFLTVTRARVPHEGRWVKATNVPIGMPILHTAEEWGERTWLEWRKLMTLVWLLSMTVAYLLFLPWLMAVGNTFWPNAVAMATVVAIGYPLTLTVWIPLSYRKGRRRGIWSGLYENGLVAVLSMTSMPTFVPYHMIEEVSVSRINFLNRMLMLRVKGFKRAGPFDLAGILGEEGLKALHQMMAGPPGPAREGPPELHVYGGRGLRISSIPGTRENGDGDGPD